MNSQQMTKDEYRVVDGHCHSSISGQSCFAVVVLFHTEKNSYYTYWWEILLLYKDIIVLTSWKTHKIMQKLHRKTSKVISCSPQMNLILTQLQI